MFIVNPYIYGGTTYLLDTYSAAAAYSLRQLKTGVTSVVRVRRSSDSAESDFTADEITDGTLTTWTGANDGFVTTWYDQVGSNDWTQSTANEQFDVVSSGSLITNSNGNTSTLSTANWYSLTTPWVETQEMSMFYVSEPTAGRHITLGNATSSQFVTMQNGEAAATTTRLGATNRVFSGITAYNQASIFTLLRDSIDNMNIFRDGTADASNPLTSSLDNTYDYSYFGRYYNTQSFGGYFSEFILFESDQSSNRTDIESDINTYYSIY